MSNAPSPIAPVPSSTLQEPPGTPLELSALTKALMQAIHSGKKELIFDEQNQIHVSQTASLFGFVYEKIRAAMEYMEEHLVTRFAIERILKRRLTMNPSGQGEAEQLVRELMWARYFPSGTISKDQLNTVQHTIDRWIALKKTILKESQDTKELILDSIEDMMTAEIEELLNTNRAQVSNSYSFYMFQELKKRIRIEHVGDDLKDAYLFAAVEDGFAKNNLPYIRYHVWRLWHEPLATYTDGNFEQIAAEFILGVKKVDKIINNQYRSELVRFVQRQAPPFKIIMELVNRGTLKKPDDVYTKEQLTADITTICNEKYALTTKKLQTNGIRSLIYIALTKALFAVLLEGPVNKLIFGESDMLPIIINSLFPVFLMAGVLLMAVPPGKDNTKKMIERILYVLGSDGTGAITTLGTKESSKKPVLETVFAAVLLLLYLGIFSYIISFLSGLHFNIISQGIFLFFACVVSYFAFRSTQIADEYKVVSTDHFFSRIIDTLFMPFLRIGKFLSGQLSKLNIFIYLFDFIIEAPLKFIIDIFEEWSQFIKKKREEII